MNFRFAQTRDIIKSIRNSFNNSNKNILSNDRSAQSRESLTKNIVLLTQSFEKYTVNRESGDGILSHPSRPNVNQENALNLPLQILQAGVTGGVNTAFLLYTKSVMLDFSYLKEPTFSAASNALGGYYSVLINSFAERERINLQYDLLRISGFQSLALTYTIPASFAFFRSLDFGRTFATRTITGNIFRLASGSIARLGLTAVIRSAAARLLPAALLRTGARIAAGTAVPGAGNIALGVGSVVLESILLALAINQIINEQKNNQDIEQYANNKAFLDLINPNNIVPLYRQTLSLLMESNSLDFSRLIGPGRNSFSSDVYNSSMLNLKRVGVQTEDILRLATDLSKSTPVDFNQLDLLTAHTLDYSLMFTGGDSKGVSSIMTSIIRATPFSSGDVNLALMAFEDFFARIVGNGQPQGAHFRLIQALAEFSNSYGAVERLSGTAPLEISKINQFMSDNGSINGRFDVSATMDVVRTADEIMFRGALSADTASRAVFVNSGMSVEEAIRGVTHNAETFMKFLNGIVESMGLSREDIPTGEVSNNSIYSNQLRNTAYVLGLNTRQTQVLNHALRRYAMGHDITSIMGEYDESSKDTSSLENNLERFVNFIKGEDTFSVLENLTVSNNKLLEATSMYAEKIILLQAAVQRLTLSNFQKYSDFIVLATENLLNKIPQVLAPRSRVGVLNPTDIYVPSAASAARATAVPSAAAAAVTQPITSAEVRNFDSYFTFTLNIMDRVESGGGYDTLFNFSNLSGRQFSNVKVSEMTINDVLNFALARGEGSYHAWVGGSTPMGRYQFVGTTLRDIVNRGNFDATAVFNKEMQDKMFLWYVKDRFRNAQGRAEKRTILKNIWEGFKKGGITDAELDKIIDELEYYFSVNSDFALGGFVFGKEQSSTTFPEPRLKNPKKMTIKIPINSLNPHAFAKEFSDLMQRNV